MPTRGRPRLYATHAEKIRAYRARKKKRLTAPPPLPPLPAGPYRVVYADPPWQSFGLDPRLGGQYHPHPADAPPWRLETLCALPVKARLMPTAMLLLWVPLTTARTKRVPRAVLHSRAVRVVLADATDLRYGPRDVQHWRYG